MIFKCRYFFFKLFIYKKNVELDFSFQRSQLFFPSRWGNPLEQIPDPVGYFMCVCVHPSVLYKNWRTRCVMTLFLPWAFPKLLCVIRTLQCSCRITVIHFIFHDWILAWEKEGIQLQLFRRKTGNALKWVRSEKGGIVI